MNEIAAPLIKVLIVDECRMFADCLAHVLGDEHDLTVLGIASTAADGVKHIVTLHPDVALVNYFLPGTEGAAVIAEMRLRSPEVRIVSMSRRMDDRALVAAVEAGSCGYLTKNRAASDVAKVIRLAAAGESTFLPGDLARILPKLNRNYHAPGSDLTERERQILLLMAKGHANAVVAEQLHLSISTVRNYVQAILKKLSAHSKLEAVAAGVREHVIDYPT